MVQVTALIGIVSTLGPGPTSNSVPTASSSELAALNNYFAGTTTFVAEAIFPVDLAGSVIRIEKETPSKFVFTPLIAIPPDQKPELLNKVVFSKIIKSDGSVNVTVPFVSISGDRKTMTSLTVEETIRAKATKPFSEAKDAVDAWIAKDQKNAPIGTSWFYVVAVKVITVRQKFFMEQSGRGGFSGVGFGVDGKTYASKDEESSRQVTILNIYPAGVKTQMEGIFNDVPTMVSQKVPRILKGAFFKKSETL